MCPCFYDAVEGKVYEREILITEQSKPLFKVQSRVRAWHVVTILELPGNIA